MTSADARRGTLSEHLACLLALVVGGVFLLPRAAHAARAPDIVKKSIEFRGQTALTFARLLQLEPDRDATLRFELSQAAEHRALPERDAALRDERGTLSTSLAWRKSDHVRVTATWKAGARLLRIEGYVVDASTGYPRSEGPACGFSSPLFLEGEIDRLPGWKALFVALRPLPAKRGQGVYSEWRALEAKLNAGRGVVLTLVRLDTWNDQNQPVQPFQVSIGFGPLSGKCQ